MKITKQGTIIKKLDQRTVAVETASMRNHPLYKKRFKVLKKYLADDKSGKLKEGDIVVIQECKPLSKQKRFKVIEKVGSTYVKEDKIVGEEVLGAEEPQEEEKEQESN